MKLSEAIRLGAMLKPQAFGDYWDDDGSCAIGAACDANGITEEQRSSGVLAVFEAQFRFIFAQPCPECGLHPDRHGIPVSGFVNTVVHLNDLHTWTRERIADWVSTIEAQPEQPSVQPDSVPLPVGERVSK